MKVKSESEVAQSCPTPSDPMDCSLPGSSTMGFSGQEWFMLCPWAMPFFQKLCPATSVPVSCSFLEPCPGLQCCLYNLLTEQPENSWPLGGKYCATTASLSEPTSVCDRHTMLARSPPVGGIPSRAFGLPGIMFTTLGVSPAGCLGPNPYHPSLKVTNIHLHQISTPLL